MMIVSPFSPQLQVRVNSTSYLSKSSRTSAWLSKHTCQYAYRHAHKGSIQYIIHKIQLAQSTSFPTFLRSLKQPALFLYAQKVHVPLRSFWRSSAAEIFARILPQLLVKPFKRVIVSALYQILADVVLHLCILRRLYMVTFAKCLQL